MFSWFSKDKAANALKSQGEADRLSAMAEDITECKTSEHDEKLAAADRLATTIVVRINNPLHAVENMIQVIRGSDDLDEIRKTADLAEREMQRILLITDERRRFFQSYKRPDIATLAFCHDLIGDSLTMFQRRFEHNHIQVERRERAEQPVNCFGGEIRQVLMNLLGNAIDSMPSGGRLLLRSREARSYRTGQRGLVISVADTGSGMTAEVQRHMFEPFYTTKGVNGAGLGLWIGKEIVDRHGGQLSLRSKATGESGTVFRLFLPFEANVLPRR